MAQASWPNAGHNSRSVTDTEHEVLAARFSDDGIYGSPADTQVVTAGTGLSVDVRAGAQGSLRGHGWESGTSTVTLPIDANAAGSTRIDWVVLRLDRSDWTVRAAIRKGTPGSGAPALVQSEGDTGLYEIPVARVTLLSGAGTVTVARAELYVGSRIRPATSASLNPYPRLGEMALESDTRRLRLWDGVAWRTLNQSSGQVVVNSALSGWSASGDSVVERGGGSIHLRLVTFTRASSLAAATDSRLPVLIPNAFRHPNRNQYSPVWLTGSQVGQIVVYPRSHAMAGQVWLYQKPAMSTGHAVSPVSMSWAGADD